MAIKINDQLKDKTRKRFEEEDEVDEIGANGLPTGRKLKIPRVALHQVYREREEWLRGRLQELETQEFNELDDFGNPTGNKVRAKEVTVIRGREDDVIGIQITYERV